MSLFRLFSLFILLILIITLGGCLDFGCTSTEACGCFFGCSPCSAGECRREADDFNCDGFSWNEDKQECTIKNCLFCLPDQNARITEEYVDDNTLIIIETDPVTGTERIIEWGNYDEDNEIVADEEYIGSAQ